MLLYHTGYEEIRRPDVHYGRKNADFGQGFYMTDDAEFACRWAKARQGVQPVVNTYELDTSGLHIHTFDRDEAWFNYIFGNRRLKPDMYAGTDVLTGPIANDTLYDTLGVLTSGFLTPQEAMRLLMIGPMYRQIVLRTERAASQLRWLSARVLTDDEIQQYSKTLAAEAEDYQEKFASILESM